MRNYNWVTAYQWGISVFVGGREGYCGEGGRVGGTAGYQLQVSQQLDVSSVVSFVAHLEREGRGGEADNTVQGWIARQTL